MKKLNIPFFPNTDDDSRCAQACMKMALKYLFPERDYPYDLLDQATYHKEGLWTGASSILLALVRLDLNIVNVELFDYECFAHEGEHYLHALWSDDFFDEQRKHWDFCCFWG